MYVFDGMDGKRHKFGDLKAAYRACDREGFSERPDLTYPWDESDPRLFEHGGQRLSFVSAIRAAGTAETCDWIRECNVGDSKAGFIRVL